MCSYPCEYSSIAASMVTATLRGAPPTLRAVPNDTSTWATCSHIHILHPQTPSTMPPRRIDAIIDAIIHHPRTHVSRATHAPRHPSLAPFPAEPGRHAAEPPPSERERGAVIHGTRVLLE